MASFYENVTAKAAEAGLSITALALKAGLSNATATAWRKGSVPKGATLKKVADTLGCSVEELLPHEDATAEGATAELKDGDPMMIEIPEFRPIYYDYIPEIGELGAIINIHNGLSVPKGAIVLYCKDLPVREIDHLVVAQVGDAEPRIFEKWVERGMVHLITDPDATLTFMKRAEADPCFPVGGEDAAGVKYMGPVFEIRRRVYRHADYSD